MRRVIITAVFVALAWTGQSHGYILERTDGGSPLFWDLTRNDDKVRDGKVIYTLNENCSADYADTDICLDILRASFNSWNVPAQVVGTSLIEFQEAPSTTSRTEAADDDINLLVFVDVFDPELPGSVIALTITWFDPVTGKIEDSDIKFNDFAMNFAPGAPGFESLEAVATHEIGHLLGLDHSFVGFMGSNSSPAIAATMFPTALGPEISTLEQDDIAGVSTIYPTAAFNSDYGSVRGSVISGNNPPMPVFGAHIILLDDATGIPIVAAVTDPLGRYNIQGVPPGQYVVLLEPPLDTAYLGPYYATAPASYTPWLYDGRILLDFDFALPGNEPFDSAVRITVTAGAIETMVDFVASDLIISPPKLATLKSSGGGGGGSGGCVISDSGHSDMGLILLLLGVIIASKLVRVRPSRRADC